MKDILSNLPENRLTEEEEAVCGRTIRRFSSGTGREAAIEKLVIHAMRDAYHYAWQCSHGRLESDAVFSLCYDALLRAARNYDPKKQRFFPYAKPYLRGLVSSRSRQAISTQQHYSGEVIAEGPLSAGDDSQPNPGTPAIDPDWSALATNELREKLRPYLGRLSPQEQLVLDLKYAGGYTFEDIGRLTRSTRSAAWQTHVRAIWKLRRMLKEKRDVFGLDD